MSRKFLGFSVSGGKKKSRKGKKNPGRRNSSSLFRGQPACVLLSGFVMAGEGLDPSVAGCAAPPAGGAAIASQQLHFRATKPLPLQTREPRVAACLRAILAVLEVALCGLCVLPSPAGLGQRPLCAAALSLCCREDFFFFRFLLGAFCCGPQHGTPRAPELADARMILSRLWLPRLPASLWAANPQASLPYRKSCAFAIFFCFVSCFFFPPVCAPACPGGKLAGCQRPASLACLRCTAALCRAVFFSFFPWYDSHAHAELELSFSLCPFFFLSLFAAPGTAQAGCACARYQSL
jgi:hypothetical protein